MHKHTLMIFILLACAFSNTVVTEASQSLQEQMTLNDDFDLGPIIKQKYSNRIRFATYVTAACLLCGLVSVSNANAPVEVRVFPLLIAFLVNCWGFSNMIKWLFVHINSKSAKSDIEFLEASENFVAAALVAYFWMDSLMLDMKKNAYISKSSGS